MSNRVSVVIPAFQAQAFLAEAIASALAQTIQPDEILVVDDGSTDHTADIAAGFGTKLRLIQQANRGLGAARNTGFAASTGDFIGFLDADDLWLPDKTERQLEIFNRTPDIDMVFGAVEEFRTIRDGDGDGVPQPRIGVQPGRLAGSMLIRRAGLQRVGPFTEAKGVGEFIDWYMRAVEAGLRSVAHDDLVLRRRIHAHNMSHRADAKDQQYLQALKAGLDRRRAAKS